MFSMRNPIRLFLALSIIFAGVMLDVSTAYAQAACDQLNRQLATLERNGDFRNVGTTSQRSKDLAASLQNAESTYVRNGCNAAAKAGQTLSRDCQLLARQILKGRSDRDALSSSLETGNAVAQQREAVLQDMARFGCRANSQATFTQQNNQRGTLFNQLFGGYTQDPNQGYGEGNIVGDDFGGYSGYHTVRSVCARLSDGFFWPMSYSTLPEYLVNDLEQCQAECPGTQVDLYYYDNPGGEPEQMVNMAGGRYADLPNAFAYRQKFDEQSSCKPPASNGLTTIAGGGDGGQLPDPGVPETITQAPLQIVASLDIPLPRPRPGADDPTASKDIAPPVETPEARVVKFGDKTVRIVGPDTPYAQLAGATP